MKGAALLFVVTLILFSLVQTKSYDTENAGRQLKDSYGGKSGYGSRGGGGKPKRERPSGYAASHSYSGDGGGDDGEGDNSGWEFPGFHVPDGPDVSGYHGKNIPEIPDFHDGDFPDVPDEDVPDDSDDEGDSPPIVIIDYYYDEPEEPAETTQVVFVETVPVKPEPVPTEPSPTEPPFPIDFSTVESALRTFILLGDVKGAASVLGSPRVISLGAGLTYPPELTPLVDQSIDRNEDPDVVAFKALAKSALDTSESTKLATAVVLSFQPDCQCSALSADEADDIRIAFAQDFTNRTELAEILAADANEELVPPGRRLRQAGKSPVSSFICAFCWPTKQCRKVRWC